MSDESETKLTPEAVKLLNELASGRTSGLNLTAEGKQNLEMLVNNVLPEAIKAQKKGSAVHAVVCFALAGSAVLFGVNALIEDPAKFIEQANAWAFLSLIPIILLLVGFRSVGIYRRT